MPFLARISSRDAWGRIFTDPAVWRPLVDHICRTHRLGRIETLAAGYPGSNAVFIVNDAFVVKIYAPFWQADVDREVEVCRLLEAHPALPTPALVAHGAVEDVQTWRYMVLTRLPGVRIGQVWSAMPSDNRLAVAADIGRMMRMVHDTPLAGIRSMRTERDAWARFLEARLARCAAHHHGRLPAHLAAQIPAYLASAAPLFPASAVPRLLHGDLTADHFLVGRREGRWRITGLIDFGDAEVGHHEYEFVALGLDLFAAHPPSRPACLRACLDCGGYPRDAGFRRRMMAYALLHRFSDLRPSIEQLGGADRIETLDRLEEALWGGI